MGFAKTIHAPSRPRTYELTYAALPDEQAVRRVLQRQYHRPYSESWADSSCRIAAMGKKQIRLELEGGLITPSQAERRRRCTPPNARLHKEYRRVCRHHSCPWCRYRTLLATFRALHHNVVQPEQRARCRKGRARTGMRNRLVLCQVKITTPRKVSIQSTLDTIVREQLVRKIQRAGGVRNGLATTSINDIKSKTVVTVSVLGISQKAVQHLKPDVCDSLDSRIAIPRLIPSAASVSAGIAICNALPDNSVETIWKAAVRGHDCPVFGPATLLRLLAPTMSRTKGATGIRLKRFQPLGAWREFLRRRMPMPGPIIYQRFRPHLDEAPASTDHTHPEQEKYAIRSLLVRLEAKHRLGEDIRAWLSGFDEELTASFRYAFAVGLGMRDISSQFRDRALRELRLNKDRLEAITPLLPKGFVGEVYDAMGKWREMPEVRLLYEYWHVKWYENDDSVGRRHDQLVRAILRGVMRLSGRKKRWDWKLTEMAIGRTITAQRACRQSTLNPKGYFDINDDVLSRLNFPRWLHPMWIADCLDEPLAGVAGYMPPPEKGGPLWKSITDELQCFNNPAVVFVIRPPGESRGLVAIHQDSDATAFGKASRIGGSPCFVQPFDNYMEFCWEVWEDRPEHKVDLFRCAV